MGHMLLDPTEMDHLDDGALKAYRDTMQEATYDAQAIMDKRVSQAQERVLVESLPFAEEAFAALQAQGYTVTTSDRFLGTALYTRRYSCRMPGSGTQPAIVFDETDTRRAQAICATWALGNLKKWHAERG